MIYSRNSNPEDSGSTSYNVDTYSYLSDDFAEVGSESKKYNNFFDSR